MIVRGGLRLRGYTIARGRSRFRGRTIVREDRAFRLLSFIRSFVRVYLIAVLSSVGVSISSGECFRTE